MQSPAMEFGREVRVSITAALVSAVLEWMLMFLIFLYACMSYLVTRFACYCQLQIPCFLCSRLDHVLRNERANFYWDLICHEHKLKISSLVLCELHNNLVDVHGTCESCLVSFAAVNKLNAETCRLLVGKLGAEHYDGLAECAYSGIGKCICCNEQCSSTICTQKLIPSISIECEGVEHGTSSLTPRLKENEVQDITEGFCQSNEDPDPQLSHIECIKAKVTSGPESECPFSDTESASALIREMEISGQGLETKYLSQESHFETLVDDPDLEKLRYPASQVKSSLPESKDLTNSRQSLESEASRAHGLEEINWLQVDHNNDVSEPSELISFSEALPSPNIQGTQYDESNGTNATSRSQSEKEAHVECGEASNMESDPSGTTKFRNEVIMELGETSTSQTESSPVNENQMDMKPNKTNTSLQLIESLDLGDAYKLAVSTRGRQLSGRLLEQESVAESTRVSGSLKLLLSQLSAARGIELSLHDMSPRVSANSEDSGVMDACGATGMQIIQRRISLERNESTLSLDGSTISEIEGESVVDRLRRQVEHDKKIMTSLYKELEEERNASAIAANQAMAMITRLQEEKASLYMEARQYLRMLEEQAEYDGEALQKANDLLADKEKQIQDFEYELELCRNQLGDVSFSSTSDKPKPESGKTQK